MYASLEDIRAEGVTAAQASDERLEALLAEASSFIDRVTGWYFEEREATLLLDGRGTPSIEPPVPPVEIASLTVDGQSLSIASADLVVVGSPIGSGFDAPRLTLRAPAGLAGTARAPKFPKGYSNVEARGTWGYLEADSAGELVTPPAIRRACILLVLRSFPKLASDEAEDARRRGRLLSESTRDQSYTLGPADAAPFTGDDEIDRILLRFRRPFGLGAA